MFKILISSSILILLVVIGFYFVEVPNPNDLEIDRNSTIVVGEGENCATPYSTFQCAKGLECHLTSEEPYRNGICLKPGTNVEEYVIREK